METPRELIEELLKDDHCLVHINAATKGVTLPDHLAKNPTVTLKLSYYFAGTLLMNESDITVELRFGGIPFTCTIPYTAIWAVTSAGGFHTTFDEKAPHPSYPALLKKDQKTKPEKPLTVLPKKKEKKERPNFLKRVK